MTDLGLGDFMCRKYVKGWKTAGWSTNGLPLKDEDENLCPEKK
jgi:hypothetical protein